MGIECLRSIIVSYDDVCAVATVPPTYSCDYDISRSRGQNRSSHRSSDVDGVVPVYALRAHTANYRPQIITVLYRRRRRGRGCSSTRRDCYGYRTYTIRNYYFSTDGKRCLICKAVETRYFLRISIKTFCQRRKRVAAFNRVPDPCHREYCQDLSGTNGVAKRNVVGPPDCIYRYFKHFRDAGERVTFAHCVDADGRVLGLLDIYYRPRRTFLGNKRYAINYSYITATTS